MTLTDTLQSLSPWDLLQACRKLQITLRLRAGTLYYYLAEEECSRLGLDRDRLERILRASGPELRMIMIHEADHETVYGIQRPLWVH